MNSVVISGNLTDDPVSRVVDQNQKVVNFSVAVNDRVGVGKEKTVSYIDVVAWNTTAEIVVQNYVKGSGISIAGKLKQVQYKDKNGNNISKIRVVADEILNAPPRQVNKQVPQNQEVALQF